MEETPDKDPRPPARPISPVPPQQSELQRKLSEANAGSFLSSNSKFDDSGGISEGPHSESLDKKSKPWRPGCFTIGFGILIALVVGGMIAGGGEDSNSGALVVACQNVVKENLKSPSTAKFVGVPKRTGEYIRGEVDAENSFGATLRNSFQCTIIDEQTVRLDYIR